MIKTVSSNGSKRKKYMSCAKISRLLGEWKLQRVQETFSDKTTFFKMDPDPSRILQAPGKKQN